MLLYILVVISMRYSWNEKSFDRDIALLEKMLEEETDLDKVFAYKRCIDEIRNVKYLNFGFIDYASRISLDELLMQIMSDYTEYGRYYAIIEDFALELESFEDKEEDIEAKIGCFISENGSFSLLSTPYLTHDKVVELAKDFYHSFDQYLYRHFKEIYESRYQTIRFQKPPYTSGNSFKGVGDCFYIPSLRKNYIQIANSRTIAKYLGFVHETGHGIANLVNADNATVSDDNLLCEIEAVFPEMIANIEAKDIFDELDGAYFQYLNISTLLTDAKALSLHGVILQFWKSNGYKADKKFFEDIKEFCGLNHKEIRELLEVSLVNDGKYVLSTIAALEFLHIYREDKKEALKLFKYFLKKGANKDRLAFLSKNIEFNENASVEADIVADEMILAFKNKGIGKWWYL